MGNVHMEATQINYRGGSKKMSVEEAIKAAGTEITPEEKAWIDTIPDLASQEIIAPEFDAEEGVYAVGDLVIYQGGLYQFTTAHETAGAWNAEEVAAVKISDELDSLKSGLTNATETEDIASQFTLSEKVSHFQAVRRNNVVCITVRTSNESHSGTETLVTIPQSLKPSIGGYSPVFDFTNDNLITGAAGLLTISESKIICIGSYTGCGTMSFTYIL